MNWQIFLIEKQEDIESIPSLLERIEALEEKALPLDTTEEVREPIEMLPLHELHELLGAASIESEVKP